ncbi:ribosomal-processing cysteine protease Prp [Treponema sp. HNW]|uniref:ribosomal-processing cysteine protease Prp n=1 Tax=Treponema sp. HNW TaxID=3116654 RepID=UPI003D0A4147
MIRAVLTRFENGDLYSCALSGHSGFAPAGKDIVCAAASILVRTALEVLNAQSGIELKTDIPGRGELSFTVKKRNEAASGILSYTADFLQKGLLSLQTDYPPYISVRINRADAND